MVAERFALRNLEPAGPAGPLIRSSETIRDRALNTLGVNVNCLDTRRRGPFEIIASVGGTVTEMIYFRATLMEERFLKSSLTGACVEYKLNDL